MARKIDDYINSLADRRVLDELVDYGKTNKSGGPCEDDLLRIAGKMKSWDGTVIAALELTSQDEEQILAHYPNKVAAQKLEVLRRWRVVWGREATYKTLIKSFIKANMPDLADFVFSLVESANPADPTQISAVQEPSGDEVWTNVHFKKVQKLIWEAHADYQNLAYALDLLPSKVKGIQKSNHHDAEACFNGVLEEVLRRGLSRKELADALESETLNYVQLANKVRKASFAYNADAPGTPSHTSVSVPEQMAPKPPMIASSTPGPRPEPSPPAPVPPPEKKSFSESMDQKDLAQWLLQEFGSSYKVDVDKLEKGGINGRLFLQLSSMPEIQEIGLTIGFKCLIFDKIKKLKPVSESEVHGTRDTDNVNDELPDSLVCSIMEPETEGQDSDNIDSNTRGAFVPKDVAWKHFSRLRVKLLKEIPKGWTYGGDPLNVGNIMSWANEWSQRGDNIPEFVLAKGDEPSEVRLEFNNSGIRRSYIGMRAHSVMKDKPTMWLDLHTGGVDDGYKKHVVIHEFGHILGLTHEHQRSNFWKLLKPFIDTEKMKKDLNLTDHQFKVDWDVDRSSNMEGMSTEYDPTSIMHYWFNPKWLTKGYSTYAIVVEHQKRRKISQPQAKVLLGVHESYKSPAGKPSKLDIQLLSNVYSGFEETADVKSGPMPQPSIEPDGGEPTIDEKSLVIYYTSGFVPFKDVVTALKNDQGLKLQWRLLKDDGKMANFRIEGAFDAILISCDDPKCLEVQVIEKGYADFQILPEVCIKVRESIEKHLKIINEKMKQQHVLAFKCTCFQSQHTHLMTIDMRSFATFDPPKRAVCVHDALYQELSGETHLLWFAPRFKDFHIQKKGNLSLFKGDLEFHLRKEGKKLLSANIDEKIKVDLSRAIVKGRYLDGKPRKVVKVSPPYPNTTDQQIEQRWSFSITYESGFEHSQTRGTNKNLNFALAPCIEVSGVGVSLGSMGGSFDKFEEKTTTVSEGKSVTEDIERMVPVPPKSKVVAKHEKSFKKLKCEVVNVGVSFNPKKKIKCMVQHDEETKKGEGKKPEKKEYELRQILPIDNDPIPDKDEIIHRTVSCKYEWSEISEDIFFDKV